MRRPGVEFASMEAFLDLDIRSQLSRFLAGHISFTDFEDWFVPVAMDVEQSGNSAAISLAHLIELRLAEFSDGYWTEQELKHDLGPQGNLTEILISDVPRQWTGSSGAFMRTSLAVAL